MNATCEHRITRTANARRRVFLVDDNATLRDMLACLLETEPDLAVCGQAGSAEEAFAAIAETQPDLVIVDISMGAKSGIELTHEIKQHHSDIRVLVYSSH